MENLREPQVGAILGLVEQTFPEAYGYTDQSTFDKEVQTYLIFRNREESFDHANAIVRVNYKLLG